MDHACINEELRRKTAQQLTKITDPVERFKCFVLKIHGCAGIKSISRKFKIMDDNHDRKLSFDEFKEGFKEVLRPPNVPIIPGKVTRELFTKEEIATIFVNFDKDGSRTMNFDEFLLAIRPRMNKTRTCLVNKVFDCIAKKSSSNTAIQQQQQEQKCLMDAQRKMKGEQEVEDQALIKSNLDDVITVEDLVNEYSATMHPRFKNGDWTKKRVVMEFLQNFEAEDTKDGKVTREEFIDYYAAISASIDEDAYFGLMLHNAWKSQVKFTD